MSIRDWLLKKLKINGKLPAVSCDELLEAGEEAEITVTLTPEDPLG